MPSLLPLLARPDDRRAPKSSITLGEIAWCLAGAEKRGSRLFWQALKECGARLAAGEEFADALGRHQAFPPLAVRVFSVGQESGKLDEMLFRLADDYDEQVKTASARFTALIEPVLILVLALMVGFLLLATILPILEAGNVL